MTSFETSSHLADVHQIQQLKSLYCDLIDRIMRERKPEDAEALGQLFTEDAVLDFGGLGFGRHQGRSAIVRSFTEQLPEIVCWMWHSVHSPIIEVRGDQAIGKWTLQAMAVPVADPKSPPFVTYGRYADEFRRVDGRWQQSLMYFHNETR